MRSGELLGLTWDCVDFEHGMIRITRQLVQPRRKGESFRFGTLKNDTDQIMIMMPITLNPTGIALIVNWKTKFNRTKNNTTIVTIDAITLYPFLCIYMY